MEAQEWTPRTMGIKSARNRWGPQRRHNVADLDPVRRERVAAFIEAERRAQERGAKMIAQDVSETSSRAIASEQASDDVRSS